jgi:hypothetical protein
LDSGAGVFTGLADAILLIELLSGGYFYGNLAFFLLIARFVLYDCRLRACVVVKIDLPAGKQSQSLK